MFFSGDGQNGHFIAAHADQQRDHKYRKCINGGGGAAGGETRLLITLLYIECGVPSKGALNKNSILSKVNEESIRGPLSDALDLVQRGSGKSNHSGTPRMKGVPSNLIGRKNFSDLINEPGMGRDVSIGMKPELGKMWEEAVMQGEIDFKEVHWVNGGQTLFKDDSRPFKKAIGFVHGEEL